ncbi:MAG: PP2C family protein-serine/threonine phosphatase [Phycisphaerae bacterium]|nr:PP2C family protein-serine/threonine phosphatase [Phycisphaerae bacterium]
MPAPKQLLIIDNGTELPTALSQAINELSKLGTICQQIQSLDNLENDTNTVAAVIANTNKKQISTISEYLEQMAINMLVLETNVDTYKYNDRIIQIDPNESAEMIKGRLLTMIQMQKHLKMLNFELIRLRATGQPLNSHFNQVTEEMQLAARLQRDFLPRSLPEIDGIKFAAIYRPATWVSGDIYDIMRLDENHVGFYIADAVGHGMPAALLTMFIKRSIVTKKITGNSYEIIDPGQALMSLNHDMCEQNLNDCQFATGCYCILNQKTLELRVASAGHPMPIRIDDGGELIELEVKGALLGVFEEAEYKTETFQLHRGDKLLIYSDGVEVAFADDKDPTKPLSFRREFNDLANLDIQEMAETLLIDINNEEGSLHPRDDVTIVGLQLS